MPATRSLVLASSLTNLGPLPGSTARRRFLSLLFSGLVALQTVVLIATGPILIGYFYSTASQYLHLFGWSRPETNSLVTILFPSLLATYLLGRKLRRMGSRPLLLAGLSAGAVALPTFISLAVFVDPMSDPIALPSTVSALILSVAAILALAFSLPTHVHSQVSPPATPAGKGAKLDDAAGPLAETDSPLPIKLIMLAAVLAVCLWQAAALVIELALPAANVPPPASHAAFLLARVLSPLIVILALLGPSRNLYRHLGLRRFRPRMLASVFLVFIAATAFATYYVPLFLRLFTPLQQYQDYLLGSFPNHPASSWDYLALYAAGPFVEELFYRGFIFLGLRALVGTKRAALLSAVLFSASHVFVIPAPPYVGLLPTQALITLVLGLLLAGLFEDSGSLWPCVLLHSLWNIFA